MAKETNRSAHRASGQASSQQVGGEKFLLFSNHPVAGTRFRQAFDNLEDARAAALAGEGDNIPEGRSPEEYEWFVIRGEEIVERGDKRTQEEA